MHIRLIAVGDRQPKWVDDAFDNYSARFPREWKFRLDSIATVRRTKNDKSKSAMEAEGKGEVISSPRVLTSNQKTAYIQKGTEIPYQEATSSGATAIQFKDAVLELKVTPQITPDDRIIMDLNIKKDSPGDETGGVPAIDTNEVSTQVLVDNGETLVLGGIYEQTSRDDVERVPFFGELPLVDWLFKSTSVVNDKRELLIFVTPKIVKEELNI